MKHGDIEGQGTLEYDGSDTNPTNLLLNSNFKSWIAGTSVSPDGWGMTGAGAVAREATIIPDGFTYSVKITSDAASSMYLQNNDWRDSSWFIDSIAGKTVTLSVWCHADDASIARIGLYQDVGGWSYSSYHTGGGDWELLTVTANINTASTLAMIALYNTGNTKVVYYAGGTLNLGSTPFAFSPKPVEEGVLASYYTTSTIVGWSSFTNTQLLVKKLVKQFMFILI